MLSPRKLDYSQSQNVYIKNTVNVANQLLDSIERDIAGSKAALLLRDRFQVSVIDF